MKTDVQPCKRGKPTQMPVLCTIMLLTMKEWILKSILKCMDHKDPQKPTDGILVLPSVTSEYNIKLYMHIIHCKKKKKAQPQNEII